MRNLFFLMTNIYQIAMIYSHVITSITNSRYIKSGYLEWIINVHKLNQ